LIACFIIGSQILLSEEFKKLGSHIVSAALFITNFKYWSEAGYFDAAAETKPLLHLWSLAVELQRFIRQRHDFGN
jgi:peptidoglycan/LPS O-acetylase OafA/YrhL